MTNIQISVGNPDMASMIKPADFKAPKVKSGQDWISPAKTDTFDRVLERSESRRTDKVSARDAEPSREKSSRDVQGNPSAVNESVQKQPEKNPGKPADKTSGQKEEPSQKSKTSMDTNASKEPANGKVDGKTQPQADAKPAASSADSDGVTTDQLSINSVTVRSPHLISFLLENVPATQMQVQPAGVEGTPSPLQAVDTTSVELPLNVGTQIEPELPAVTQPVVSQASPVSQSTVPQAPVIQADVKISEPFITAPDLQPLQVQPTASQPEAIAEVIPEITISEGTTTIAPELRQQFSNMIEARTETVPQPVIARPEVQTGNTGQSRVDPVISGSESTPAPASDTRIDSMSILSSRMDYMTSTRTTEWSGVLDYNRLITPSSESQPVKDPAPAVKPSDLHIPVMTGEGESSRVSRPSRFDTPFTEPGPVENKGPVPDQSGLLQGPFKAPVNHRPLQAMEPLPVTKPVDPVVTQNGSNEVAGTSAEPPVVSSAARSTTQSGSSQVNYVVDPEALVSDVREVVMRIASDGQGEVRMNLHPPELGELLVRIESARNGIVRAEFHTVSPMVRETLQAGIDRLIQALEAEGLTLAQADVHLNLQLGSDGGSGETAGQNGNGSSDNTGSDSINTANTMDERSSSADRLPDGATISILA